MIQLLPVFALLTWVGVLGASAAILVMSRMWLPRLNRFEPARRCRWILVVLALPLAVGVLLAVLAFGPCLSTWMHHAADGCRSHAEPDFYLCLLDPAHAPRASWLVAALFCAALSFRAMRLMRRVWTTRRAASALQQQGHFDPTMRAWIVPGSIAVVAGWPGGSVYLGQGLLESCSGSTIRAVLAHERAHMDRGDLHRKILGRALSLLHMPALGRMLIDELDLAIEQACDGAAARAVGDPLEVARAIVELACMPPLDVAVAFAAPRQLEARVKALCDPSWLESAGEGGWAFAACGALVVVAIASDWHVHELAELLFERLAN